MNFLIMGDGPDEEAWARAIADDPDHRLWAACPGLKAFPSLPGGTDLDGALAIAGVGAVLAGGDALLRSEGLRRAASVGLPVLCLHPPGPNADPYYHVALSRAETGAVVVPDLPARLHPGVAPLAKALREGSPGTSKLLRYEATVARGEPLVGVAFARAVDMVRSIMGEVEAVNATGDPTGSAPTDRLVVQLRGPRGRRAEVRLEAGPSPTARLAVASAEGSLTLEFSADFVGGSTLIRRSTAGSEVPTDLGIWDAKAALLRAFAAAERGEDARPNLLDGTRAMEVMEAAERSLRKGRTIDMIYEEMSEAGNFKSVMASTGCAVLLGTMFLYIASRMGPAIGLNWTEYLAWLIPPTLILFVAAQLLRLGLRSPAPTSTPAGVDP